MPVVVSAPVGGGPPLGRCRGDVASSTVWTNRGLMVSLRDWARSLLDRYAADLSPEIVEQKRRLLDMGEQALVAQDLIAFGLRRQDLSSSDLDTAREYVAIGVFGKANAWLSERLAAVKEG